MNEAEESLSLPKDVSLATIQNSTCESPQVQDPLPKCFGTTVQDSNNGELPGQGKAGEDDKNVAISYESVTNDCKISHSVPKSDEDKMDIDEESDRMSVKSFDFEESDDDMEEEESKDNHENSSFSRSIDLDLVVQTIKEGEATVKQVEGRDCVLIIGKTGTGKSSLIQALAGKKFTEIEHLSQVRNDSAKKVVYQAIDPLPEFQIGHETISETSTIKCFDPNSVGLYEKKLMFVDSPGFGDTRGHEVDIATSVLLSQVAKSCRSLRYVIMISFVSLLEDRGNAMRSVIRLIHTFAKNFDEEKQSFMFLFSHANEIKGITDNIDDAKKRLCDEIIRTIKGTPDEETKIVLKHINRCLKKNHPFVNVFMPLQTNGLELGESILKNLKTGKDPHIAKNCVLTHQSLLSLSGQLRHMLVKVRKDIGMDNQPIFVGPICNTLKMFQVLGDHINVEDIRNVKREAESLLTTFIHNLKLEIEKGIGQLKSSNQDFGDYDVSLMKNAFNRLEILEGKFPNVVNCQAIESRVEEKIESFYRSLLIKQGQRFGGLHKSLSKLMIWSNNFSKYTRFYTDLKIHLTSLMEENTNKCSMEKEDLDKLLEEGDLLQFFQCLAVLSSIEDEKDLLAVHGLDTQRASKVYHTFLSNIESITRKWIDSMQSRLKDMRLDYESITILSENFIRLDKIISLLDKFYVCQDFKQLLSVSRTQLVRDINNYFESIGSELETSTANPDDLKCALEQMELASKSFQGIEDGSFRQLPVIHGRVLEKVRSELMKLVGQVDQISEEVRNHGVNEGVRYGEIFCSLKAMNWIDDMLPDAAFVGNVLISFERTISDRNEHVGMELNTVMNQIISGICDLSMPCKTFESLLLESKQISLFVCHTGISNFESNETQAVKNFREYIITYTDQVEKKTSEWRQLLIHNTLSNMEMIDSKSEEIEYILRNMKSLAGIDSQSDSKVENIISIIQEASSEISKCMTSTMEMNKSYKEKLRFLKILRTLHKYSNIKKGMLDLKELQSSARHTVASHAQQVQNLVLQTPDLDLIDTLVNQLEEAKVLDEFTQNEASLHLVSLKKLRNQKLENNDKDFDDLLLIDDFEGIRDFLNKHTQSKDILSLSKSNKYYQKIYSTLSETVGSVSCSMDGDITKDSCENIVKGIHKLHLSQKVLGEYLDKSSYRQKLDLEITELETKLNDKFLSLLDAFVDATSTHDFERIGIQHHLIEIYKSSKIMMYINDDNKKKEKSCQDNFQNILQYVPKAMSRYLESNFADSTEFFHILSSLRNSSLSDSPCFPELQDLYKDTKSKLVYSLNEIHDTLCKFISKTMCYDDAIDIMGLLDKHLNYILKDHIDGSHHLSFNSNELLKEWKEAKQENDLEMEFDGSDVEEKIIQWKSMLNGLDPSKANFLSRNARQLICGTTYQRKQREISNIVRDRSRKGEKALREDNHALLEECINVLDLIDKHLSSHVSGSGELSKKLQQKAISQFLSLCEKLQKILQSKKPVQLKKVFAAYSGYVLKNTCIMKNNECNRASLLTNQLVYTKLSSDLQEIVQMIDDCELDKIYIKVMQARQFGDFVADHFTLLKEELSCSDHDQDQDGWLQKIFDICVEHFSKGKILSHLKDFATLELAPSSGKGGVNKAYKRLAKKYHPDKNPSADANEVFRTLTEAKDRLIEAIDSKKESESPFGSLIKGIGRSLRKKIKSLMDEQRYDRVENILFAMKDLKSLKSLVTPNLDVTDITNDIHSLVKSYVQKAKTAVSTNWAEKQYKSLNYNITDLRMMEERFKSYENIFPSSWNDGIVEQIEEKIIKLGQQARGYLSSEKSAKKHKDDFRRCFMKMGSVLVELPLFKDFTKAEMSSVLETCLDFNGGYSFLFEFGLSLRKNDEEENNIGQILLAEFSQFKEVMTMVWNEETSQKPAEDTVKMIQGDIRSGNVKSELPLDRDLLLERFHIFEAEYKKLLGEYIDPDVVLKSLVLKIKKLSNKLQPIDMKHGWTNKVKEQIPYILAGVFTVFTVLKSGASYNRMVTSSNGNGGDKLLMKPHNVQVLALLSLFGCGSSSLSTGLDSQVMQIRTGEGKSIILGAASVVLALLGFRVRCVCYSDYLSTRDYNLFQDIFETFSVTDLVKYSKITTLVEDTIAAKGNIRQMTNAMLKGMICEVDSSNSLKLTRTISQDSKKTNKRKRSEDGNSIKINGKRHSSSPQQEILLVDEVDVFFGSDFYGKIYNILTLFQEPEIESILKHIWMVNKRSSRRQRLSDIKSLPSYHSLLKKMHNFQFLVDAEISLMIDQVRNVDEEPYYLDREADKIGYKVMDSICFNTHYGYSTVFAYLEEADKGNLKNEEETLRRELCMPITCGKFSYAEISPQCILGVSGTLSALGNFEYEVLAKYGVEKYLYVPSVYGKSNFQFDKAGSGIHVDISLSDYFHSITDRIKELTKQKRAVIVFFENNARLQEFVNSPFYGKLGRQKKLLTENLTRAEKEFVISKAATSRQITLSTAVFGRGTDFFCKDESVIRNGGVHVIQTFLSEELSEEIQIQGRTARQGKKGSYEMILWVDDLSKKFGLSKYIKDDVARIQLYNTMCEARERSRSKVHSTIEKDLIEAARIDEATHSYFDCLLSGKYNEASKMFKDVCQDIKKEKIPSSIQVDICLLIDTTGSMEPYRKSIVDMISSVLIGNNSIVKKLESKFPDINFVIRVGLLSYRDLCDRPQFIETIFNGCHFTNNMDAVISNLQKFVKNPSGGGDLAEDHLGAINRCLGWNSYSDWAAQIKCILLFTDSPAHGMVPRNLWSIPNNDTRMCKGRTVLAESVVDSLVKNEINLFFCSFNQIATLNTERILSSLYQQHPKNSKDRGVISLRLISDRRATSLQENGKHIIFVLDMSGSMSRDWSGVVGAYRKYIFYRKQSQSVFDLVSVVQFNDRSFTTVAIAPLYNASKNLSFSGGGTNFYPAAQNAYELATKTPPTHTPIVVFMTDSCVNDASAAAGKFSELNRNICQRTGNDLELHVIAFGSGASTNQLQTIANSSRAGKLHRSADAAQLSNIFVEIANEGNVTEVLQKDIWERVSGAVSDRIALEYTS